MPIIHFSTVRKYQGRLAWRRVLGVASGAETFDPLLTRNPIAQNQVKIGSKKSNLILLVLRAGFEPAISRLGAS